MSLYGDYILEREGKMILENDNGFATYQIQNGVCYVENVFVKKEMRRSYIATQMMNEIARIAKENGCSMLYVTVIPSTNGSTASLEACLAYGFLLKSTANNFILMEKEL